MESSENGQNVHVSAPTAQKVTGKRGVKWKGRIEERLHKKQLAEEARAEKKASKEASARVISFPAPRIRTLRVTVVGLTALIQNKMAEETLAKIEAQRAEGGSQRGRNKDLPPVIPEREFRKHIHFIKRVGRVGKEDLRRSSYGIPNASFQKALAATAYRYNKTPGTVINAAVTIMADVGMLIRLKATAPSYRRGYGNKNGFHIFYQPVYWPWSCVLCIRFNEDMINDSSLISLLKLAGISCGVGNNRKEKGGENGTFEVTKVEEEV